MSPTSILITGASSGIGEALALAYAKPGIALFLSGRDRERLSDVTNRCRTLGAEAHSRRLDVTDRAMMDAWVGACNGSRPLDLVVANAGISAGTGGTGETAEQARAIFATNVGGLMNTVLPAIEVMRPRKSGQIAIVSSLAGYRGLGGAPAYCASKAAVKAWGEGLRDWLADDGIRVSVICPGFVTTRLTATNRFKMPFLMDSDRAARIIISGLAADRGRIAFPWPMAMAAWLAGALPNRLMEAVSHRLPRK
ncbi:SDR family NAD(P)-dependent oxidoreductase [Magnetospirillum moscoviense]|uniref:Short-chain dehydrogenase n=1 Tax=Magnetospirillum moscoviense TaxID=1437059 RepID=A0A178MN47_9PROT|nr:SDR family NAD(P)-dependent oxidoreductase [Magnetospirillum moscoviense]OAN50096.1 short-chain dehydrogenase [Magnetospirillum moscoviense]